MNSRKKQFVNPIKIEVTRRARTETILGKPLQFSMGINLLEPMTHMIIQPCLALQQEVCAKTRKMEMEMGEVCAGGLNLTNLEW